MDGGGLESGNGNSVPTSGAKSTVPKATPQSGEMKRLAVENVAEQADFKEPARDKSGNIINPKDAAQAVRDLENPPTQDLSDLEERLGDESRGTSVPSVPIQPGVSTPSTDGESPEGPSETPIAPIPAEDNSEGSHEETGQPVGQLANPNMPHGYEPVTNTTASPEPVLPPVAPTSTTEPPQPTVVDAKADAFQAQAAEVLKKDPQAEALANYYKERATSQRGVTALENQLNTLSPDSPERPLVQAQLDLAKAQNALEESRAQELESIAKNIDAMTKKGNNDEQIAIQRKNLGRLHVRINTEALSQANPTDIATLANLAKDTNNSAPWSVKLQELGITTIDFSDPKKVEEAQKIIKADLDFQQATAEAYKKNEKALRKKAKEIDDAIRHGEHSGKTTDPNTSNPQYLDTLKGEMEGLQEKVKIDANAILLSKNPDSAKIKNIDAKAINARSKELRESQKENKKEAKFNRINKPSLRNAWNQLGEAWRIARKGTGEERKKALREVISLGWYIGRKLGLRAVRFLLLLNLLIPLLAVVVGLKKINDTFGGGH